MAIEVVQTALEAVVGGTLGGVFRLAPELFKLWDRRNERKHELAMQEKALGFERLRGAQRMQEIGEQGRQEYDRGALAALVESIRGQSQMTGNAKIDGLNQSVRPVVTYMMVGLYLTVKVATAVIAGSSGSNAAQILAILWTSSDIGLLAAILNFWFLNRVFEKAGR